MVTASLSLFGSNVPSELKRIVHGGKKEESYEHLSPPAMDDLITLR